jgi:type II secretory pathway component PulJ
MWIGNMIIALIFLALAVAGAWRWYDSHLRAQSKIR